MGKALCLIGPAYWLSPINLIPNSLGWLGSTDEVIAGFLGLVFASRLVPSEIRQLRLARKYPDEQSILVFCHCPKTAGTSLFRTLSHKFGYGRSYLMRRQYPDLPRLRRNGFRLVSGHCPFRHYRDSGLLTPETLFISFYREPAAVLLSRFAHILRHKNDEENRRRFFDDELAASGLSVTGSTAVRRFLSRYAEFDVGEGDNPQTRFAANQFYGPLQPEHLERAKESLSCMAVIGCTERFEDSLKIIAHRLGWRSITYYRLNVSEESQRVKPEPELTQTLEEFLCYDRCLVEWAEARFKADFETVLRECADRRIDPPEVILASDTPPFRYLRNRLSALSTFSPDDWKVRLGLR